jgi:hypothetical protein
MAKLNHVTDPIPKGSRFASPIYLLSEDQHDRMEDCDSGWVGDGVIAKELQNECENTNEDGKVLYPVYIESDSLEDEVATEELFEWYEGFLNRLGIDSEEPSYYFSGNRSIHVHVPRFVVGEKEREALKSEAEEFCEETGAELDCGIYSRKGLFRLPGAVHSNTDLPKVEVSFGSSRKDIISKAANTDTPWRPDTFTELLEETFGETNPTPSTPDYSDDLSPEVSETVGTLVGNDAVLSLYDPPSKVEVPVIEREEMPEGTGEGKWMSYNRHPFSPYAHASGGERSVAIVRVRGKPFCRDSHEGISRGTFTPTRIIGAVGCDENFSMTDEARLRLSDPDFEKWCEKGFEKHDTVVLIGGKSRRSIMFEVDNKYANTTASCLLEDGKSECLHQLEKDGYEIGSAGSEYGGTVSDQSGMSEAQRLQISVESGKRSIQAILHEDKLRIANRLLRLQGYDEAFDWFREAFGSDFDENITRTQLNSVIRKYDDLDMQTR